MKRRSRWLALGWALALAVSGALIAYFLVGSRGAVIGAIIGAVSSAFAPPVRDALVSRSEKKEALDAVTEKVPPRSWARLLDPRREVAGFLGREDELAALIAWCEDDNAGRLRLVTGPGGVGKTRLAVELADRMRQVGRITERVSNGADYQKHRLRGCSP